MKRTVKAKIWGLIKEGLVFISTLPSLKRSRSSFLTHFNISNRICSPLLPHHQPPMRIRTGLKPHQSRLCQKKKRSLSRRIRPQHPANLLSICVFECKVMLKTHQKKKVFWVRSHVWGLNSSSHELSVCPIRAPILKSFVAAPARLMKLITW